MTWPICRTTYRLRFANSYETFLGLSKARVIPSLNSQRFYIFSVRAYVRVWFGRTFCDMLEFNHFRSPPLLIFCVAFCSFSCYCNLKIFRLTGCSPTQHVSDKKATCVLPSQHNWATLFTTHTRTRTKERSNKRQTKVDLIYVYAFVAFLLLHPLHFESNFQRDKCHIYIWSVAFIELLIIT